MKPLFREVKPATERVDCTVPTPAVKFPAVSWLVLKLVDVPKVKLRPVVVNVPPVKLNAPTFKVLMSAKGVVKPVVTVLVPMTVEEPFAMKPELRDANDETDKVLCKEVAPEAFKVFKLVTPLLTR
jgi:hypothetical protein